MNMKWALNHDLMISPTPVFKLFLEDQADDDLDTVFYIRGSIEINVGRFLEMKVPQTFLIFDPLDIECEDFIFRTSDLSRVNRGKIPLALTTPQPPTEAPTEPAASGGSDRTRMTKRLGFGSLPKKPKSAPSSSPSTTVAWVVVPATDSITEHTKMLVEDLQTVQKLDTKDAVVACWLFGFRDLHFINALHTVGHCLRPSPTSADSADLHSTPSASTLGSTVVFGPQLPRATHSGAAPGISKSSAHSMKRSATVDRCCAKTPRPRQQKSSRQPRGDRCCICPGRPIRLPR